MQRRNVLFVLSVLGILGLIAWGITTASSQEPVHPEEQALTAPSPLGIGEDRLVSWIFAYSDPGPKTCYYDASVRFKDGNVGQIESIGELAKERIHIGDPIADLPSDMQQGTAIPIPVHIGEDGKIRPGYDFCEFN